MFCQLVNPSIFEEILKIVRCFGKWKQHVILTAPQESLINFRNEMSDCICFSCPLRGQMCSGQKLSKVLSQHFFALAKTQADWLPKTSLPLPTEMYLDSNISNSGTAKWQCHVEEILPTWLQIPWFSWKKSGPINCTVVAIPFCGAVFALPPKNATGAVWTKEGEDEQLL